MKKRKKVVCTDVITGCNVSRKRRGKRNRSRKIKVDVTLKDLGKSRQSLYVAFQYFLSGKEAKNSEHASASAFSTFKFNIGAKRGQVHLGNAFPVKPTALRPFLLKLGHSVLRFGKTEFQTENFPVSR